MKLEVSVPEVVEIFKEIQEQPEKVFEMIRVDMRDTVGQYLTQLMRAELTALTEKQGRSSLDNFPSRPEAHTVLFTQTLSTDHRFGDGRSRDAKPSGQGCHAHTQFLDGPLTWQHIRIEAHAKQRVCVFSRRSPRRFKNHFRSVSSRKIFLRAIPRAIT